MTNRHINRFGPPYQVYDNYPSQYLCLLCLHSKIFPGSPSCEVLLRDVSPVLRLPELVSFETKGTGFLDQLLEKKVCF